MPVELLYAKNTPRHTATFLSTRSGNVSCVTSPQESERNLQALFDLDFRRVVTPTLIKIVYILIMVMLGIGYLVAVFSSFQASTGFGIFTLLILGPLFVLLYLVLARASLESLLAAIRTAENTAELVRLAGGHAPGTDPQFPAGPQSPAGPSAPTNPQMPNTPQPGSGPAAPTNPYQQ